MPQLATICYIDNGKELLMLHRNKKPNDVHAGKWIGVGGKLERGETPQECAAREILEETGLKAKPVLKGATTRPVASITSAPSSLISGAILIIFPSSTKTSQT